MGGHCLFYPQLLHQSPLIGDSWSQMAMSIHPLGHKGDGGLLLYEEEHGWA